MHNSIKNVLSLFSSTYSVPDAGPKQCRVDVCKIKFSKHLTTEADFDTMKLDEDGRKLDHFIEAKKEKKTMLKVQQLISSLNEDKSIKYAAVLDAFAFERGAGDPTEKFTSKIGKDSKPYEYTVPVETKDSKPLVTSEDPQKLLSEAINAAPQWFPEENPILAVLTAFSARVNGKIKADAKAKLEPVDLDSAVTKLQKFYEKSGLPADVVAGMIEAYKTSMAAKKAA